MDLVLVTSGGDGGWHSLLVGAYREPPEVDLRVSLERSGGWRFRLRLPPEVPGGFQVYLRRFSEVAHGAKYGEFLVVAIFTRRLCGVFSPSAPEDPQNRKMQLGLHPRQPPGLWSIYLRSLRNFEDQDLVRRLIDYVIARN